MVWKDCGYLSLTKDRKFLLLLRRLDTLQILKSLERFLMVEKATLSFLSLLQHSAGSNSPIMTVSAC